MPTEAFLHDSLPRHQHIIEYLGFHVIRQLRINRLYTVYAELGGLNQLFKNHGDALAHRDQNGEPIEARVPIVALLYIFEAMAAGVCLLAHAELPDDEDHWPNNGGDGDAPSDHWGHNVINSDIKPANYILSRSTSSTVWPGLPVAALGDFGNGHDLDERQYKSNIHLARGMGTKRWQAPEQGSHHATEHPVTSAANVYQIGLCIMSLMTLSHPAHEASYEIDRGSPFPPLVPGFYPATLVDVVTECLEMGHLNRPSPKELYMDVRNLAKAYPRGTHGVPLRKCSRTVSSSDYHTDIAITEFEKVPTNQFVRTEQHPHEGWMAR